MKKMTEKQLRDLDAWIAEHVFGWQWYCTLGKAYLFPPHVFNQLKDFDVHWTKGLHEKGWTRTEPLKEECKKSYEPVSIYGNSVNYAIPFYHVDSDSFVQLLKKCTQQLNKTGHTVVLGEKDGIWNFGRMMKRHSDQSLEIAVCLCAKEIFQNANH